MYILFVYVFQRDGFFFKGAYVFKRSTPSFCIDKVCIVSCNAVAKMSGQREEGNV